GTIAAMDLATRNADGYLADVALTMRAHFLDSGILLRPLGATIYVMPPYCITRDELAAVYAAIGDAAERFAT
ncbi:MAG: adenosylmethionine--8-amino-7-oxononanoate transaminase, partial [Hyphomicrobium sp.]